MAFVDTGGSFTDPTAGGGIDSSIVDASSIGIDPSTVAGFDPNSSMFDTSGLLGNNASPFDFNTMANMGFGGVDPGSGTPVIGQTPQFQAQNLNPGNQLPADQTQQSSQQQGGDQQNNAMRQTMPQWFQNLRQQFGNPLSTGANAAPFTVGGGAQQQPTPPGSQTSQDFNQRFSPQQGWDRYIGRGGDVVGPGGLSPESVQAGEPRSGLAPLAPADAARSLSVGTPTGTPDFVATQSQNMGVNTGAAVPTEVSAPPASETYTGGPSGGDTGAETASADISMPSPRPRDPTETSAGGQPSSWDEYGNPPGTRYGDYQQPGQQPGGQQPGQQRDPISNALQRIFGINSNLARLAAQALRQGMMGGQRGMMPGFFGRMPGFRGGFPGRHGRGMRGGFRGGVPPWMRGRPDMFGNRGGQGLPFSQGGNQGGNFPSDTDTGPQTDTSAPTADQQEENERIASGQTLTPAEQAAGGQAPGTPGAPSAQRFPGTGIRSQIANALSGSGASDTAIAGIMQNIQDESGFRPGLPGDRGQSHGLYQFHQGGQWPNYVRWLQQQGRSDWQNPQLQSRFVAQWLQRNRPDAWRAMNAARTPG